MKPEKANQLDKLKAYVKDLMVPHYTKRALFFTVYIICSIWSFQKHNRRPSLELSDPTPVEQAPNLNLGHRHPLYLQY